MVAKTIPGYFSKLTQILEASDHMLPAENMLELKTRLANDGDWTTLLIQDTVGYEVVKVVNFQGNIAIDRGLSGTTAKRFPIGSCVSFSPSDELLHAVACEAECCENGVDETYGNATEAPHSSELTQLPPKIIGRAGAVMGEPDGFMLINGKKVPYFDED